MHNNQPYHDFEILTIILKEKLELKITDIKAETESKEYLAIDFEINAKKIKFRRSKISPTKTGQFVTLWQRNNSGIIEPFSINCPSEIFFILCLKDSLLGAFIFSKKILQEEGILSSTNKVGKLGFRIYPDWDSPTNTKAIKN